MKNSKLKNILYAALLIYTAISVAVVVVSLKNANWDPALTLKMTDNAYKNIPFNHYEHPAPANLDKDETEFVTWWSPGQFALPLLIEKCFNLKLIIALKILTLLCLFVSGFGIYKLYRELIGDKTGRTESGTPAMVLALLLFTIIQPFFFLNLFVYDGGGILMLAYCPWFIYWVIKSNPINIPNLLLLLLLAFIGFFLKTAFTSIFAGALFYLFLINCLPPKTTFRNFNLKKIILGGIYLGLVFMIYVVATKVLFLDHNTNISNSSPGIRMQPRIIVFPVIAPVLGLFVLGTFNKTLYWLISFIFVVPLYYFMLKSPKINHTYKCALIGFTGICIAFYSMLYFINVDVSYELRHYVIITILITPAFFLTFWRRTMYRYILLSVMGLYAAFNLFGYAKTIIGSRKDKSAFGYYSGLALAYPADLINKIHSLDSMNNKGRDIFYLTNSNPEVALEIKHNRVLLEDNYLNFHFNNKGRFNKTLYYGQNSGEIYVIYPIAHFKTDSIKYLTRFEKYKKFETIYKTKGFVILKALYTPSL
ncbi:hypothetical protein [Mucilaginibacter sp. UR6-11]|uniref:hypothetical protein n=1 Tax=Mucilaginibacter sp. UR6-11 TaxID=1435644 RepID=UPI001E4BDEBE|nr:hypothetical protein [Mucilaginibacter sp. UR6-11]MCC8423462.1 hypothetical protein [Mucilaginibacter sp. UR6-11]